MPLLPSVQPATSWTTLPQERLPVQPGPHLQRRMPHQMNVLTLHGPWGLFSEFPSISKGVLNAPQAVWPKQTPTTAPKFTAPGSRNSQTGTSAPWGQFQSLQGRVAWWRLGWVLTAHHGAGVGHTFTRSHGCFHQGPQLHPLQSGTEASFPEKWVMGRQFNK